MVVPPVLTLLPGIVLSAPGALPGEPGGGAGGTEVRAIWVTRWDFRSAQDVRSIVQNCAGLGLNRVYFQVRGRADAFYRSALEPWGEELGGRDPGFDPLRVALEEARARRIELHAWVNVLSGWKGKFPPRNKNHIYYRHPEWYLLDPRGRRNRLSHEYTMVNPCLPAVRHHIVQVVTDILRRYPVDGLHIDYIRFFGVEPRSRVPYDRATRSLFLKETGRDLARSPVLWDTYRRNAVDRIVQAIAAAIERTRPACQLSAAVVRDFQRAGKLFFQDPPNWVRQRWVDLLLPMHYEADPEAFAFDTSLALKRAGNGRVHPGIGVHLFKSPENLLRQITASRSLGCGGFCLFAYSCFYPTSSHASRSGEAARRLRSSLRRALRELLSTTTYTGR